MTEIDSDADAERLAENKNFLAWEAGWKAGAAAVQEKLPMADREKNPYQWHGIGYVPKTADLGDIQVRAFIGSREIAVTTVGQIVQDMFGTRIEQIFINPEPQ